MFSRKTSELEKADLLGERIFGGAKEAVAFILEELGKRNKVTFRDERSPQRFVIEVIVFYMHMVDRLAFIHLGASRRKIFADRFVVVVFREVLRGLNDDVSAQGFSNELRDTYNTRQVEYARYKDLLPPKEQQLKGTLYWEFSKILFGLTNSDNPSTLIFLNLLVADCTKVLLVESAAVEHVLKGQSF